MASLLGLILLLWILLGLMLHEQGERRSSRRSGLILLLWVLLGLMLHEQGERRSSGWSFLFRGMFMIGGDFMSFMSFVKPPSFE
jgi:hypothetical protein